MTAYDCKGNKIEVGDNVLLVCVKENLLRNLPPEDQVAIKAQEGNILKIVAFDNSGCAEIEFDYKVDDSEVAFHTIWVEPSCLEKRQ